MATFIGTFENKVDKKGRVSVPATFRQALAGQGFQGIVAFPSHRADALEACGMDFIEEMKSRMDGFDLFSDDQDDLAAEFTGEECTYSGATEFDVGDDARPHGWPG